VVVTPPVPRLGTGGVSFGAQATMRSADGV